MNFDDIVYALCLLLCIGFGKYFRTIKDDSQRKLIGTAVGVVIIFVICGIHALHCFLSFTLCALIITKTNPGKCHLKSFICMFGYLVIFRTIHYFGIPAPSGHANMIQMILTLKMTGVALEINIAYDKIKQRSQESPKSLKSDERLSSPSEDVKKSNTSSLKDIEITEYDIELQNMTIVELFHYAFNYIGVILGPYYRYRTYRDYFETPFKNYADCDTATTERLKSAGVYCGLYLIANYIWPLSYVTSDEFYQKRSILYRLFYTWPNFIIFRMRIYTGITLGECVCTYAGFAAYPDESDVATGEGPKKHYLHLKRDADKHKYNFDTIKTLDVYGMETCVTFRESMKHWNICVQYWLATNVYRRFPSKKYRTLATLFISSYWHGFYPGHYICLMAAAFYTPVEDIYYKFYLRLDDNDIKKKIFAAMFWLSRFLAFGYLITAFLLLTIDKIWVFYSSIYFVGHIYYVIMLIIGLVLLRNDKFKEKRIKKLEKEEKNEEPKKNL